MSLIIYPNQLFEKKYIPKHIHTVILYEHPVFFTKYKFNKLKLVLHRASMKEYIKYLSKHYKTQYIAFDKKMNPPKDAYMFYQPNKVKVYGAVIDSPNFMCYAFFDEYREKTDKFVFNNFYLWMKSKLNVIADIKSLDKYNRNRIPDTIDVPKDITYSADTVKEAVSYVTHRFPDNPGPDNNAMRFLTPITHTQARSHLSSFVKARLHSFGKYQDAMLFESASETLFHSCISAALNIGLLNPLQIVKKIVAVKGVPINSTEAFIRQLFWREYQLYCYIHMKLDKPVFKVSYGLSSKWMKGTTGMPIVDNTIIKAFDCGYLHHIERLMIMGNFMLLSGLTPQAAHKWFMMFSLDSYEWVMWQNVYDMIYGMGNGMSRIYISSSNYILKMSDLKKGEWCDEWDALFHAFLKQNKGKVGYPYE